MNLLKKIVYSQAFPPPVYDQLQYANWKPGNEVQQRQNNLHSDRHAFDVGRTWHPGQTRDNVNIYILHAQVGTLIGLSVHFIMKWGTLKGLSPYLLTSGM